MPSGTTPSGFPTHWQEQSGQFVKITDLAIEQQTSAAPGFIVKKGENFNYRLNLEFSELLGQLGGGGEKIKIGIFAHDISTGNVATQYSFNFKDFDLKEVKASDSDTQKTFNHTDADFKFTNANTLGVFLLTIAVIVPATGISTFSTGPLLLVFP
ncbi:MAG: hypothetical protein ACRENG_00780 [bacterium]